MGWKLIHIGAECETVMIGGVDVWSKQWKTQGEAPIPARHPSHPEQVHSLNRYFIEAGGKAHEFAAGEVSPGVWLFYGPERAAEQLVWLYVAAYGLGIVGCFILIRGFEHSLGYAALGAVLLALAIGVERYAKRLSGASEA
jgi:hypothetical protein